MNPLCQQHCIISSKLRKPFSCDVLASAWLPWENISWFSVFSASHKRAEWRLNDDSLHRKWVWFIFESQCMC